MREYTRERERKRKKERALQITKIDVSDIIASMSNKTM